MSKTTIKISANLNPQSRSIGVCTVGSELVNEDLVSLLASALETAKSSPGFIPHFSNSEAETWVNEFHRYGYTIAQGSFIVENGILLAERFSIPSTAAIDLLKQGQFRVHDQVDLIGKLEEYLEVGTSQPFVDYLSN
jgi:hypothetical protein